MTPRYRIIVALGRIVALLAKLALPWVVTGAGVGAVAYLIADTLVERGVPPLLLSLGAAQFVTGLLLFRVWRFDVRLSRLESAGSDRHGGVTAGVTSDVTRDGSRCVTPRDTSEEGVTDPSRGVTGSHAGQGLS